MCSCRIVRSIPMISFREVPKIESGGGMSRLSLGCEYYRIWLEMCEYGIPSGYRYRGYIGKLYVVISSLGLL